MTLKFSLGSSSVGVLKVGAFKNSNILEYPCESLTICTYYDIILPPHRYIFEAWGAEGGLYGGKGGYTKAFLTLHEKLNVKVFIGAKGTTLIKSPGVTEHAFNGGGPGGCGSSQRSCSSGGGSTDLRVGDSLYDRILVAGAGGGGTRNEESGYILYGAHGGGTEGKNAKTGDLIAYGGNQVAPGIGEDEYGGIKKLTHSGRFGFGGYGNVNGTCGGGGSGWFGGAGGAPSSHLGGGGGSGYILSSSSNRPESYSHNESSNLFMTGYTMDGSHTFPSCNSTNRETGHEGNGCFRITVLDFLSCKLHSRFGFSIVPLLVHVILS